MERITDSVYVLLLWLILHYRGWRDLLKRKLFSFVTNILSLVMDWLSYKIPVHRGWTMLE
jgi:hypothetical protein